MEVLVRRESMMMLRMSAKALEHTYNFSTKTWIKLLTLFFSPSLDLQLLH